MILKDLQREKYMIKKTNRFITHTEITTIGYLWEAEEDHSKETSFYCLMPSKQLFDGLKMQYADEEGIFLNEEGKVICFDAGVVKKSKNYLLIRKPALLDYLKTHHKKILWYVLGEKNIIGLHNYNNVPNLPMWPVMSGTYTLNEEDKVVGCIRTSHKRW